VPVDVLRGYQLPACAGAQDLAFFVSYSGNTEETLSAWEDASRRNIPRAVVASGGALLDRAADAGVPLLRIPAGSPPRAALGWTSLPVFRALGRLGAFALPEEEVLSAAAACEEILSSHGPGGPQERILAAWGEAAALRLPVIYAADRPHRATATRWVGQLNENAKTLAHAATLPEQNHNEIVAWGAKPGPGAALAEVVLLDDAVVPERVRRRLDLVASQVESVGGRVTRFAPAGQGLLARLYSLALLGDLASLHVAAARGVDPTPVEAIDRLKSELG
jgi:glucose/mannose-6-phosphate isomerase